MDITLQSVGRATVLALVAAAIGCGENTATIQSAEQHLKAKPTSVQVQRRDIVGYALMEGSLYLPPDKAATIKAPYASSIQEVLVKEGDHVERGQTLVKMALPEYQAYFAQAKANLDAAQSAYNSALATNGAEYKNALRQLDQARATERALRVQAAQSGDATDLNAAIDARQSAEQNAIQAKAARDAQVLPAKQQLDQAQREYALAKSGVRQANVQTPIEGVVTDLHAAAGQSADNTTTLADVVDLSAIQVKADLTPDDAALVEQGKRVVITFMGLEDKPFDGVVSSVRTLPADPTGVKRQATIDFKNDSGLVKPGMTVKAVGVKVGEVHDALAVPADAVFHDKTGKSCVRVVENGGWVVRTIETGLSDGFFTQVKSGLEAGDTVRVPGEL